MLSFNNNQEQQQQQQQQQQQSTIRLRDITSPIQRSSRKRKSSPDILPSSTYQYPEYLQQQLPQQQQQQQPHSSQSPPANSSRPLSSSKRAEQNRKAQRAFRERRDQHVKALESRSQLLDAALASADEANRRWEECRAIVDQLRLENTALRAALGQSQMLPPSSSANGTQLRNSLATHPDDSRNPEGEYKNDSGDAKSDV